MLEVYTSPADSFEEKNYLPLPPPPQKKKKNHCTFDWYFNALHKISHNVQSAHACWCNKEVSVWLYVCTGDNPLAKARGLSSRTKYKPNNNLHVFPVNWNGELF